MPAVFKKVKASQNVYTKHSTYRMHSGVTFIRLKFWINEIKGTQEDNREAV